MKGFVRHLASAAAVAVAAVGQGCVTQHHSAVCDVDPHGWSVSAEISYTNSDTLTLRDAALFLRCNERLKEDTLTVRIATITPDSLRFEESLQLEIPRTRGAAALTREVVIPYRHHVRLARTGDYRFRITPVRTVRGIEAVGIHLTDND